MKRAFLATLFAVLFLTVTISTQGKKDLKVVPTWAKNAVWYQIFPERFANGDQSNDPAPEDMKGAWPYEILKNWQITPWNSDWYKLQPWEKANGHDFYWNAGTRRYGGDIKGIIDKLNYLQELGIRAVYCCPVFESPSLHKYDTRMYHHVDDNFGPDPKGDKLIYDTEDPSDAANWHWTSSDKLFLSLIQEVHKRGMKIIIDGVFNHVGTSFWAFQDIVKNQENSKFKDWFSIKSWDNQGTTQNEFDYEGWIGIKDLPEIKEDKNGLVKGFAEHIHKVIKRWMDPNADGNPNDGIDGWRLDVAEKVNLNFWKQFRIWVKEINPEAYITGEIWWDNWNQNEMFNASAWLQGDAFDGVMNYRFAQAVKMFVIDEKKQISSEAFADSIMVLGKQYPKDNLYAALNLMDSHDVDRLASQIINPDKFYDHQANPQQNKDYKVRGPNESELLKQKLIVGMQMTMPGAPMIYYGDEAGMWGGDDPDCRKPMVWKSISYEKEVTDPFERERTPDVVAFNGDLFNWYKKLIGIRKANLELSDGNLEFFYNNNSDRVVGYKRALNNKSLYVIINNNNQKKSVELKQEYFKKKDVFSDLINGKKFKTNGGKIKIDLLPYQVVILRNVK